MALRCYTVSEPLSVSTMYISKSQEAFLIYWLKRCPNEPDRFPAREDINPAHLGRHMAHIIILDVLNNPRDFQYRLVGTYARSFMHNDDTGKKFSELPGKGPDSSIWATKLRVLSQRKPLLEEVKYVGPQADFTRVLTLHLPLAKDGQNIDMIVSVLNFISTVKEDPEHQAVLPGYLYEDH